MNAIQKALSVAGVGSLENYLPEPLAMEVIAYIRDINIMRRHLRTFKMNSRTWTKPRKNGALSAYYVPDGVTAPLSSYSSGQVKWEAKKLMSFVMVDEEAIEDSQPDVVAQVLEDFGGAIGEAEELAILDGNPTHTATAPTPQSATAGNWFVYDPRLIFEGIFPTAIGVEASTAVDAGGAILDLDMVNEAIFNLGKYGRNRGKLMGLLPSVQSAVVRQDSKFKSAEVSGQALASFITGLGTAGEGNGLVTIIYGIPFFEAPMTASGGQITIIDKSTAEIGDRRMIKFKSTEVIEADQRKYVVSERVAFNYNYRAAMVAIKNLSEDFGV
jgi:hypothetical protein